MSTEPMKLPRGLFPRPARPPSHLGVPGRRLWRRVVEGWTLEAHHLHLLQVAAEAADRAAMARHEVEERGLVLVGARGGVIVNPAAAVEREAQRTSLRALREMGLDIETPGGRR